MNKPSKSKAEVYGCDAWPERCTHTSPRPTHIIARMEAMQFPSLLQSAEDARSDAETLRALQFALNPETESEQEYNHRMDELEQDRYDMQEAE